MLILAENTLVYIDYFNIGFMSKIEYYGYN